MTTNCKHCLDIDLGTNPANQCRHCRVTMTDIVDDFHKYQSGNKNFPCKDYNPEQLTQVLVDDTGEFQCGFFPAHLATECVAEVGELVYGKSTAIELGLTPLVVSITDDAWPIIQKEMELHERAGRYESPRAAASLE